MGKAKDHILKNNSDQTSNSIRQICENSENYSIKFFEIPFYRQKKTQVKLKKIIFWKTQPEKSIHI